MRRRMRFEGLCRFCMCERLCEEGDDELKPGWPVASFFDALFLAAHIL